MNEKSGKVKVFVRVRPPTIAEEREKRCLETVRDSIITIGEKSFTFERVFDEATSQANLYQSALSQLIESALRGYNGTVFACNLQYFLIEL
jgi:hypothetical protein